MSITLEQKQRNVIPRWRSFEETIETNELAASTGSEETVGNAPADISEQLTAWLENRTLSFAGDLLSAALATRQADVARDAAEYVLGASVDAESPLSKIAKRVLNWSEIREQSLDEGPQGDPTGSVQNARIKRLRHSLRAFPRDAIAWTDLARLYTILGINDKARRAIQTACSLAPQNRFVIRSAARFYAHLGEMDSAHSLVLNSGACKHDPWLAASEVALSSLAKTWARSAQSGLAMISGGNFSDFEITELATAIGTLDHSHGQERKAKKLIKRGLVAPNDNSLAQAKWISRSISGLGLDVKVLDFKVPRQFEASAYEFFSLGRWAESFKSALSWCRDEPFSSRAAKMACYVSATMLEEYEIAARIADIGLISSAEDEVLINHKAFCFASLNWLDKAEAELAKLKSMQLEDTSRVTWLANHGLISFRLGNIDKGREWYLEAVDLARSIENEEYRTTALLFWAREEALKGTELCPFLFEGLHKRIDPKKSPDKAAVLERIESRYVARPGHGTLAHQIDISSL